MSSAGGRLTPLDAMWVYGETPSTMMHVASLMPFQLPKGAKKSFVRHLVGDIQGTTSVEPPWNLRLKHPTLRYHPFPSWVVDRTFDLDYHVRRSALPAPGDERELGMLISRLHSNPLDLSRPPWEMHVIEGLERNRFAVYVKLHHSLMDGYTGSQLLSRTLSKDPKDTDTPPFFAQPQPRRARPAAGGFGQLPSASSLLGSAVGGVSDTVRLGKALLNLNLRRGEQQHLVGSVQAPWTILNRSISRNRRFATQRYELSRLQALSAAHGATLNDVVLSIIGGGLRRYLDELDALPGKPMIAFVPVSVRPAGDVGGGNATGLILASMGTDVADPVERLQAVVASTRAAKAQLDGMGQEAILAYSTALLAPVALQAVTAIAGVRLPLPIAFNVVVSNVPGPRTPRYLRGARLEANYPVSIPTHGMGLNITLYSYADTMDFGFVGCRETVPGVQRLAVHTGAALAELESRTPGK